MGLRPSPYVSFRGVLWLKEESHGDPSDPENVFRWERVELNLPGQEDYAPHKSWVSKRRSDGSLAADSIRLSMTFEDPLDQPRRTPGRLPR